VCSRLNSDIEMSEDTNSRTSRITEVNILKFDTTLDVLNDSAFWRFRIDFWTIVEQFDDIRSGNVGFGNVGDECEYVSCLDSSECDTLQSKSVMREPSRE